MSIIGKVVLIALVGSVAFVSGVNRAEPEIKTVIKFVEVPTVQVQKTVETKTVTVPMPAQCKEAIDLMNSLSPFDEVISSSAGNVKLEIEKAQREIVMKDFASLNDTTESLVAIRSKLGQASVNKGTAQIQFKDRLEQCNALVN